MKKKKYSGFTNETAKHLLLNAGAFFKNFDPEEDTFDTAVKAGKLIGATKGGGEFSAVPTVRQIEVDGISGRAKGLETIDSWDVYLKANVLEVTTESLKMSLASADVDTNAEAYDKITANADISLSDYIDNVAWVGTLSGSEKPAIIIVKNALNTDGLKITSQDKNEAVIAMTFYGHYTEDDLDSPPFEIYYPKAAEPEALTANEEGEE